MHKTKNTQLSEFLSPLLSAGLCTVLLLCALLAFAGPSFALEDNLTVLTHDLTGQAESDPNTGELRGIVHSGKRAFNLEAVREIMAAVGIPIRIREVSFAQGMEALATRNDVAFFNVYRSPQREQRFKWVGPLQREIDYLYGLQGNTFSNLDEARSALSICAVEGSQHHDLLLERGFKNIISAPSYQECFSRLKSGTATLAVSSDETLLQKLHAVDIPVSQISRIPEPLLQYAGYIAFSPQVDDRIIRRWQEALNILISSGRFQTLYDLYYER
ncbi:transporter substrate-binding domain-containing protein [uncultured Pseudodesulfovibrio sp.]|uniref:substrate-binding periplasmic protein n=1 Tax=uncultured Pseudodesulfovibrio sp. TaxID=2035858 RepID=UPI0029C9031D|nr:transporter substrate-binding domain-containing protein [uncultured Pseudodesulfovibrio sp.]